MLWLQAVALAGAAVLMAQPAASAKAPQRVTFDLDRYQGWWRVRTETGEQRSAGECSGLPRCRPWLALTDGTYTLSFSDEPQSEEIRFSVQDGGVSVDKGGMLVAAEGSTLTLLDLKPVTISLNGYMGPWLIGGWTAARDDAFFTASGVSQKLDLVPLTTYALSFGAGVSERIQVGLDGKVLLIDSKGSVEVSAEAPNRLEVKTIDVVIYPQPATKEQRWNLGFRQSVIGRPMFEGVAVVRLVEGSTFEISLPGEKPGIGGRTFVTGKGCNMVTQRIAVPPGVFHVVPIAASCSVHY